MSHQILLSIFELIITIVCGVVAAYVLPWIKSKVSSQDLEMVTTWASIFVRAAEQMLSTPKSGDEKLELVTKWLKNKSDSLHLNLTDDEVRALIEDAVKLMNDNKEEKEE